MFVQYTWFEHAHTILAAVCTTPTGSSTPWPETVNGWANTCSLPMCQSYAKAESWTSSMDEQCKGWYVCPRIGTQVQQYSMHKYRCFTAGTKWCISGTWFSVNTKEQKKRSFETAPKCCPLEKRKVFVCGRDDALTWLWAKKDASPGTTRMCATRSEVQWKTTVSSLLNK